MSVDQFIKADNESESDLNDSDHSEKQSATGKSFYEYSSYSTAISVSLFPIMTYKSL